MKLPRTALGLSIVAALALGGCMSNGPNDPLTGTWSNTTCFGSTSTPPDIAKCSVALTFTPALTIELDAQWISLPATATYPRCTIARQVTGQHWSTEQATSSETLTVTGSGKATLARANCVNMADNLTAMPTTDISIPSGATEYQISNGKLTILSGDLAGTYSQ
jgi:hypothetical protein